MTFKKGQNGNWKGRHHTEETKNKMSKLQLGKKNSFYGKHHTKESKQKKSLANMGQKRTEETRKKLSLSKMGHIVTEETIQKIREKALKQFENGMPEETRKKMSLSHKGKRHTEESKKKMSEAQLGEKNHLYGKHHTEETIRKMISVHTDWDFYNEHGCIRSQYPYPPEFYKQRPIVAERDNYICQMCNEVLPDDWGTHHINYDKSNNDQSNLIYLCAYCHGKTSHNKAFWEQYFKQLQNARGFGEDQYNSSQTVIDNWT